MNTPGAAGPVAVLSLTVLLAGPSAVPAALLWRNYQQERRFAADLLNLLVSAVVVVVLARRGDGALALAWSRVAGQGASTLFLLLLVPGHRRPGFDRRVGRELLGIGLPLAAANLVVFATLNVDYLVVGKTLGAGALGLYLLAFNVSSWPTNVLGVVVRSISVPTLGRLRDAPAELRAAFLTGLRIVALLALPVCFTTAALAHPLVVALYGARWETASQALLTLGLFAAGRTVTELLADTAFALGRSRAILLVQLLWLAGLLPLMLLATSRWGIAGAGIAHTATILAVVLPAYGLVLRRHIRLTGADLGAVFIVPAVAAVISAVAAHLVAAQITHPWLALLVGGSVSASVYVLCCWSRLRLLGLSRRTSQPTQEVAVSAVPDAIRL